MAKVYLSPSTQDWNDYAGGSNEEVQMRAVAALAAPLIAAAGHTVKVGGIVSAKANALDGNAWGADWYVAIHSNAGGGHGTEGWHYPGSTKGALLAQNVYERVAKVSSLPDRGVKESSGYIELNTPHAPATIIETAFHDNLTEANEIKAKHKEFATAIAQGVLATIGGPVVTPAWHPVIDAVGRAGTRDPKKLHAYLDEFIAGKHTTLVIRRY